VLDKLANWRERPAPEKLEISDGTVEIFIPRRAVDRNRHANRPAGSAGNVAGDKLHLFVPSATSTPGNLLEKALAREIAPFLLERLACYAPLLGVAMPALRLSSARTRWGSCSHHGGISLNWRLILHAAGSGRLRGLPRTGAPQGNEPQPTLLVCR
jgi:predicted metal-dependent hydrolase